MLDLVEQPYTDNRVSDIPRSLQTYYRARGYYEVKVDATGNPEAATNGKVQVVSSVTPGPVYHFAGVTAKGLQHLRPSHVTRRFRKFSGKTYSPGRLDEK